MLLSYIASNTLKRRFKKYSKIPSPNGMTGYDVARQMLASHGINDVKVEATRGHLSDHYNPTTKTIKLSEAVFYGNNIAALAIAAHECGHAVQHARAYTWLTLRSQLVPIVELSSRWVHWVILAGFLIINTFPQLLLVGIVLFAITTLFSFITLPVEIDASKRALTWLSNAGITNVKTHPKAKSALRTAAYTYVIAALGSLASLAYYLMIYLGVDD
jgi:Zn-dependent membrane protease YugP